MPWQRLWVRRLRRRSPDGRVLHTDHKTRFRFGRLRRNLPGAPCRNALLVEPLASLLGSDMTDQSDRLIFSTVSDVGPEPPTTGTTARTDWLHGMHQYPASTRRSQVCRPCPGCSRGSKMQVGQGRRSVLIWAPPHPATCTGSTSPRDALRVQR